MRKNPFKLANIGGSGVVNVGGSLQEKSFKLDGSNDLNSGMVQTWDVKKEKLLGGRWDLLGHDYSGGGAWKQSEKERESLRLRERDWSELLDGGGMGSDGSWRSSGDRGGATEDNIGENMR